MSGRIPFLNARLQGYTSTIFAEMSALAVATGSINLGQGFPDTDGPEEMKQAAIKAIRDGHNQYPPGPGIPELRSAIAWHQKSYYDVELDPDREVLVTAGATEAIAAALLALCEVGDEVVMFEPYYDSYAACTAMAGATRRVVTLNAPDWSFDPDELEAAITDRTRIILINTPHNPTGKVFTKDELDLIAKCCVRHNLIAITDEVYEHLVFDAPHLLLSQFPGMSERTVTISSAAKTFSVTGWKVGWVTASPQLVAAVRTAKQFLTFVNAAPFQHAIAAALVDCGPYIDSISGAMQEKRDLFSDGLCKLGFDVFSSMGTFFVTSDIAPLGERDGFEFCHSLPQTCGVVAIPSSVFYDNKEAGKTLVRWTICKKTEVLEDALERLERIRR